MFFVRKSRFFLKIITNTPNSSKKVCFFADKSRFFLSQQDRKSRYNDDMEGDAKRRMPIH